MPLKYRELSDQIIQSFSKNEKRGLILAGIVGCGKTTLIEMSLEVLAHKYQVVKYTGDDAKFRSAIAGDTKFFVSDISAGARPILIFVDEVQKSENIFDALKYAFDHSGMSFIVSGSNPLFLNRVAIKRLQRRAEFFILHPFSMIELLDSSDFWIAQKEFLKLLLSGEGEVSDLVNKPIVAPENIFKFIDNYFVKGGLPLSQRELVDESLRETQKVFERGFEPVRIDAQEIMDHLSIELAELNAREFTYQNIFRKIKSTNRSLVNSGIENLMDHGYLNVVTPYLVGSEKKSYLKKYFYVDPGIVTYLTGELDLKHTRGYRLESYVFNRLFYHLQMVPIKNKGIYFYKPFTTRHDGTINFYQGEMDAIIKIGQRVICIEIKSEANWTEIDTTKLEAFVKEQRHDIAIVLYAGPPKYFPAKRILFWPFWVF